MISATVRAIITGKVSPLTKFSDLPAGAFFVYCDRVYRKFSVEHNTQASHNAMNMETGTVYNFDINYAVLPIHTPVNITF